MTLGSDIKDWLDLALGSAMYINSTCDVRRVPSGWVMQSKKSTDAAVSQCFIPEPPETKEEMLDSNIVNRINKKLYSTIDKIIELGKEIHEDKGIAEAYSFVLKCLDELKLRIEEE